MSLRISRPYRNLLIPSNGNLAINWTWSPNPQGARQDPSGAGINAFSYQESAFGNGRWVTSSTQSYPNQRQLISTSSTADFFDICGNYSPATGVNTTFFANGRFFLGISSTNVIPYSTDGLNWTDVSTPSTVTIGGFTSIPSTGRIVGIGTNTAIYSDNSGNSWNTVSIPTFAGTKIAYNPDADILAAVSNTNGAVRSLDKGITWTKHDISTGWFSGIAYGNGVFIAVNRSSNTVWRSTDASNWTLLPNFTTANYAGFNPRTIAFGNGVFAVAMASFSNPWPVPPGPLGPGVLVSNDNGDTWQVQLTQYNINGWANRWQGVTYANGIFVVSAEVSSGPYNMTGKPFYPVRYILQKVIPKYR